MAEIIPINEEQQNLLPLGTKLWTLSVVETNSMTIEGVTYYAYAIRKVELTVCEIRIGRGFTDGEHDTEYGFDSHDGITYLVTAGKSSAPRAFTWSAVGDFLIGQSVTAGIRQRAYLNEYEIQAYANYLSRAVQKKYAHVSNLEIEI